MDTDCVRHPIRRFCWVLWIAIQFDTTSIPMNILFVHLELNLSHYPQGVPNLATTELPSYASVVVIGGGIMGCSTLYHLASSGVSDAILLERNELTSGTTWHSAAQVRALRSTRNLTDLIRYSIDLYSRLESETGQQTGWINKGSISIATTQDRLIHIMRQEALARCFGVRAQSVSIGEAKDRWPHMNADDVIGAVWSPDDGRVSPSDLCAAMIKGAKYRGVKVFEHTSVHGITTQNHAIKSVETNRGSVRCDAIALCTGLWSREMGQVAGVDVPVWPCEHFYLLTKSIAGITGNLPTLSDHDNCLYIRDDSGGLLVGCFEPRGKPISPKRIGEDFAFQLLDEDWDHFEPMMTNAMHRLPALETAEIKMLLNGPESFTPDGSFLLGESAQTRGFFLGCGMNSVGVASSGGAGMALAHCIQHGHMPMDLSEVEPNRFSPEFNSIELLSARVPEVLGKHYEITYPGRQWKTGRNLRRSPLDDIFEKENAYFGQFYGWERPLYFDKAFDPVLSFDRPDWHDTVECEVGAAHKNAALFDQSTFGKIDVEGEDACEFLNRLCTNQFDRKVGRAIYTTMLNERGGVESDLTAVRIRTGHYRLYVGTTSLKKNLAWLNRQLRGGERVKLTDTTDAYAVIGLMGPKSPEIAVDVGADSLNALEYFEAGSTNIAGHSVLAVRLSYVGESGWELTCPVESAKEIYSILRAQGAEPAGLFAQTSMRIEKKFLAFGHELDCDTTPLDAGLGFTVDWSKDFIGKKALQVKRKAGAANRVVSIVFDDLDAVPLGDEPVLVGRKIVGKTTSAAFGFRVGAPVALAVIENSSVLENVTRMEVNIAGALFGGSVLTGAAFDPTGSRMKRF